jgi:hypothetical protein
MADIGFYLRDKKINTLSTNDPKIIFTVHGTVSHMPNSAKSAALISSIQVLARLSLGFAIFITGWIGGELADVFKDEREVVFMIALFIPLLSFLDNKHNLLRIMYLRITHNHNK